MAVAGCFKPRQAATFRVTKLDSCGYPVFDDCSYGVSDGYTQIEITPNVEEGQRFLSYKANGQTLINERARPVLNWFDYSIQMQEVDPELFILLTGVDPYENYNELISGFEITEENFATGNAALEVWLGNAEEDCPPPPSLAVPWHGYVLLPWIVEGSFAEAITFTNDVISFTISGRTRRGSPWGVGPYDVELNQLGQPAPLRRAVTSRTHYFNIWTQLPPPEPECGCLGLES